MVSVTFLEVCRQSDELSPSTKYFYPEYEYLNVNYIYTYIYYDSQEGFITQYQTKTKL